MMYSTTNYGMGEVSVPGKATTAMTGSQAEAAKRELERMRRSLVEWLKTREINDRVMAGQAQPALLRRPGTAPPPAAMFAARIAKVRAAYERSLAANLYALLSEVCDPSALPSPDLSRNPQAAVQLAQIAISGRLPQRGGSHEAQGLIWLWPAVIALGVVAFTISSKIRSDAEVAKEREKYECIKAGACTDSAFWTKVGAVAFVGWLVWDKLGVGAKLTRPGGGRR